MGIGILGVCRGDELTKLTVDNIRDSGKEFILSIPTTKTKVKKMYVIEGGFTDIIRQYIKLRPPNVPTDRFFVQYRDGKCRCQVIGKNVIAKVPKEMAKFLKLPNPNSYTGHSYRRSGTTIAANNGATIEQLKRMGGWKSSTVFEKYIQESIGYKRQLGRLISGAINFSSSNNQTNQTPSASTSTVVLDHESHMSQTIVDAVPTPSETVSNLEEASSAATFGSFGINIPNDKKTILFNFQGQCHNFTVHNYKH